MMLMKSPKELEVVEKILVVKDDFVSYKAKWIKNNKFYFVKKIKNISNYIIEEMLNEIEFYKKLDSKVINPVRILKNN